MTYLTDTADRPRTAFDFSALDGVDRILLGGCAAVWLAALGAGVAATVALVDLGSGRATSGPASGTPWILYTVIAVSAVVIVAAVPLLLRARRAAAQESTPKPRSQTTATQVQNPVRGAEAPTEKFRLATPVSAAEPSGPIPRVLQPAAGTLDSPAADRLWLRSAAGLASAMGAATLLTAVSTYLMAVDTDTVAWVLYGLAGVITLGMVAIPIYFLRELRTLVD